MEKMERKWHRTNETIRNSKLIKFFLRSGLEKKWKFFVNADVSFISKKCFEDYQRMVSKQRHIKKGHITLVSMSSDGRTQISSSYKIAGNFKLKEFDNPNISFSITLEYICLLL